MKKKYEKSWIRRERVQEENLTRLKYLPADSDNYCNQIDREKTPLIEDPGRGADPRSPSHSQRLFPCIYCTQYRLQPRKKRFLKILSGFGLFVQGFGCCWVAQWNVPKPSTMARASTPIIVLPGKRACRISIASLSRGSPKTGTITTVFPI